MPCRSCGSSITSVLSSSPRARRRRWYGARSICEYCLAAPTSVGDPGGGVVDLAAAAARSRPCRPASGARPPASRPAHAACDRPRASRRRARPRRRSGRAPSRSATPWSSSQSPSSSSRVGGLQRGERRARRATCSTTSLLQRSTSFSQLRCRSIAPVGDHRQLVPHAGDPVAQRGGGPHRGGGRVVQLVGEPGGQRAERQQPLPLADQLAAAAACPRNRPSAGAPPSGTSARNDLARTRWRGSTKNRRVGDRAHGAPVDAASTRSPR